ncbi:hypothetical protein N7537_002740 [Penicillium hordei]|uniref:RBR-type E3 ubiquitin transferase n=1 Tax=Penicillium hordei TaxID=40994 RepID=A0AAD6H793_9EURO|nr:uncharacterized protein N7537_002740 [Penicillium hordei]KAJ5617626.1 hypothetical protein N7537_002740 [Penicillium hordei]
MTKSLSSIRQLPDYLVRVFVSKKLTEEVSQCTGCFQKVPTSKLLTAPCEHQYCPPCLRRMSSIALNSLEMFPAKCCSQEIPAKALMEVMSSRNKKLYIIRWEENSISPLERLYCSRERCGRWIPRESSKVRLGYCVCPHCRAKVCSKCGDLFHLAWSCSHDSETKATLELAKENNWQRCPNCLYLVEKVDGCNHIICRCGHTFCYLCGQRGQCECPLRDIEDEDLDTDGDLDVNTVVAAMEQAESAGEPCWWEGQA